MGDVAAIGMRDPGRQWAFGPRADRAESSHYFENLDGLQEITTIIKWFFFATALIGRSLFVGKFLIK